MKSVIACSSVLIICCWYFKKYAKKAKKEMTCISDIVNPHILKLVPYRCARDDYSEGILLDANENSYGPSVHESTSLKFEHLERYPCPYQMELKGKIAKFRDVKVEQIFLGVGSDEAIDLMLRVTCLPKMHSIIVTPPTYGMYSVCANINMVNVVEVPLTSVLQLNMNKMLSAMRRKDVKVVFLCHPGNPTAVLLQERDILRLLEDEDYEGLIVVDEAYIDFAGSSKSFVYYLNRFPRLVVLQTLSKGFGLAGIRLGMAMGDPELIQHFNNVKAPYNINKLTSKVANEAFDHLPAFREKIQSVLEERDRVMSCLKSKSYIVRVLPSDANFVVFQVRHAYEVYKQMANSGVVIRYRGNLIHLKDCLRATIGTHAENNQMLSKLDHVVASLHAS